MSVSAHARGAASLLLVGVVVGFGVSCGPEVVYEQSRALPAGHWTYADSLAFDYTIADTTRRYDLALTLEHGSDFATENLYARFVTRYPDGRRESEPVSLALADRYGRWLGDCARERCRLTIPLQDSARYPAPGTYGLTLHQHMRRDSVPGVHGIGFAVTRAD